MYLNGVVLSCFIDMKQTSLMKQRTQLEVFEFEIEMHLMLLWGHFFEFTGLLVQSADGAAVGW